MIHITIMIKIMGYIWSHVYIKQTMTSLDGLSMEASSKFTLLLQQICYSKWITTETLCIHYSKKTSIYFKLFAVKRSGQLLMEKIVNKLYDIIFPMVRKHTTYLLGISIQHILITYLKKELACNNDKLLSSSD